MCSMVTLSARSVTDVAMVRPGDRLRVLRHAERKLEVVQPFHGPRPELHAAILGAHGDGATPDGSEIRAGSRGAAKRRGAIADGEERNRAGGGVCGRARRRELCRERRGDEDGECTGAAKAREGHLMGGRGGRRVSLLQNATGAAQKNSAR